MALLCVTRHVTSGESAHHLRCVLPYYAVRDIRHGVRCPGNDVNRFMCVPGQILLSRFSISPLFEQPGQKHPRKIANSALPHNIRHHTSAEFRASGFAYIERSRDGLSRFPKRAPELNDAYLPPHKYRKLLFAEHYLMVYQVAERKVFVDFIVDCRQDYQWLIR